MSNIFAMVTIKNTNSYTNYALKSFFKNTTINDDDDFLLIDNDGCKTDKFSTYGKIKIIKNNHPLNFAENVNQVIDIAIKNKKDLIFLTNDLIFTKDWVTPILLNSSSISIPSNNQIFQYQSECGNLKLKFAMDYKDFNENYELLNDIAKKHKKRFNPNQKIQTLLMPFSCFKIPYYILNQVGYLDNSYGTGGGEDIDYRIRCAIKGHDVNFLIDSYILHFNGMSTWGIETKKQIEERNKKYTEVFSEKWGSDMTQVFILRRDFFNILEKKGIKNLFNEGKFSDLIRKMLQKN